MWNLIFPLYGVNPSTAPLRLQIKLKRAAEWRNRTEAVRLLYFVLVQYCKLSTLSRRPNTVRETSQLFARCSPNVHLLLSQCCAVIQDCGMIRLRDCLVMAQTLHIVITFDLLSFWYRGLWIAASLQYERRRSTEDGSKLDTQCARLSHCSSSRKEIRRCPPGRASPNKAISDKEVRRPLRQG